MNFSNMTIEEAEVKIREYYCMDESLKESVIKLGEIYIAQCRDGIVEFSAKINKAVSMDEFIEIERVLNQENGKMVIQEKIDKIKKEAEDKVVQELLKMNFL